MLKWLHSQGCPWDEETCRDAAVNGHLEVLQFLHSQDCPWNLTIYEAAALSPNVKMQQWAQDNLKARDEMEWLLLNELKQMTL
jgi:hypothetical protein